MERLSAPRSESPMEELNHVPMAELTKKMPRIACGPAEMMLMSVKKRRRRRRRPAPGKRRARCRRRRTTWNIVIPKRTRGRARAARRAMVAAAGSAPVMVVMNVREKAMMMPIRMMKSSTRMMRPREVFSAMAARSTAFIARPCGPRVWPPWMPRRQDPRA